jgi:transglutaminase-like putative cysteine protease
MTGRAFPWIRTPTQQGEGVRRPLTFASLEEKAAWLDAAASLDARHPGVRAFAQRFQKGHANDPGYVAREIHKFARDGISYCFGPSHQEFADTWTIIAEGGAACDNCAGKSRVFVALCRAIEIDARIVPNFASPDDFNHVQAQVRWAGSERDPNAGPGGWLRVELIVRGVPLGAGPSAGQRTPSGGPMLT